MPHVAANTNRQDSAQENIRFLFFPKIFHLKRGIQIPFCFTLTCNLIKNDIESSVTEDKTKGDQAEESLFLSYL